MNCKFNSNNKCMALNIGKCAPENCKFFKTEKQADRDEQLAFDRLRLLSPATQRYIAGKYYRNKFPWFYTDKNKRTAQNA